MTASNREAGSSPAATAPRRVAVVAVHGVADQQPGQTARQIADLLRSRPEGPHAVYPVFHEETLRLPVTPLSVAPNHTAAAEEFERSSHGFMVTQLRHYQVRPGEVYQTVRLAGRREDAAGAAARRVDVYEAYWADLSRLGKGGWQVFGELFQLLFHLPSLGQHAISPSDLRRSRAWEIFRALHDTAVRLLNRPIPILNALLLALGLLLFVPDVLASEWHAAVLVLLLAAIGLGAAYLLARSRPSAPLAVWLGLPLLAIGLAVTALRLPPLWSERLLAGLLVACALAVWIWLVWIYDRRRPGALSDGALLGACLALLWLAFAHELIGIGTYPGAALSYVAVFTAEIAYILIYAVWWMFVVVHLLALPAGALAWRSLRDPQLRESGKRLVQTARITLALPAALLAILGYTLWLLLLAVAAKKLDFPYSSVLLARVLHFPSTTAYDFTRELVTATGEVAIFTAAVGLVLALVLVLWALLPSIVAELHPPQSEAARPGGEWLTKGYTAIGWGASLVVAIVWAVLPGGLLARLLNHDTAHTLSFAAIAGGGLGATLLGFVAFTGRLVGAAARVRPALDVLLDVDNHLRLYPLDANPRAAIATRFASLLRYLVGQDGEEPYDAIVIVAHSQGSVIAADLLRFLRRTENGPLSRLGLDLPVCLFTMGCPLRQLYGVRFPNLYAWARHGDEWKGEGPIPVHQQPDPVELGVTQWVNAYRSGDYVGRQLWLPDDRPDLLYADARTVATDEMGTRRELCVGAGAHTHYWDSTGIEVAKMLDHLVAIA